MPSKPTTSKTGKIRWSQDLRRSLYSTLVTLFGPYDSWTEANPSGLDDFCATFARRHGASNAGAVRLQMTYAITQPKARGYKVAEYYALNKAAAVETGFLARREAWASDVSTTYQPIACETLLHGFYFNLPHQPDEQSDYLEKFTRDGFKNGMEFDNYDKSRLTVACEGLLRLTLALHTQQLRVPGVVVGVGHYEAILAALDEVRRGFERLRDRLPRDRS